MPLETYQTEIIEKLDRLEREGKGRTFTLCSFLNSHNEKITVKGFIKGKKPKTLITACHHANELYGTYDGILEYAEKGKEPAILIPVVDVENFCLNKEALEEILKTHGKEILADLIKDMREGCSYDSPPMKRWKCWAYGTEEAPYAVKALEDIIKGMRFVMDIHNCAFNQYLIISELGNRRGEDRILEALKDSVYGAGGTLYEGDAPNFMRGSDIDGVYQPRMPNSILKYASQKGIINAVMEVPVFEYKRNSMPLADFKKLRAQTASIISEAVKEAELLSP